jgi:hypothetical protein
MPSHVITFTLPEEEQALRCALDGAKWKSVAEELDQELRNWGKYGKPEDALVESSASLKPHKPRSADDWIRYARETLARIVERNGLELWD